MGSPDRDPAKRELAIGDLVRVSQSGTLQNKKLKDRDDALGRILSIDPENGLFDIEWILGGRSTAVCRSDLVWSPPDFLSTCRKRKKPTTYSDDTVLNKKKTVASNKPQPPLKAPPKKAQKKVSKKKVPTANKPSSKATATSKAKPSKRAPPKKSSAPKKPPPPPQQQKPQQLPLKTPNVLEKHHRELERFLTRLETKIDLYRCFWEEAPPEFVENYDSDPPTASTTEPTNADLSQQQQQQSYPSHPPYNWEMIRRRLQHGRYQLDRIKVERDERLALFGPYYKTLDKKRPRHATRVLHPKGIDWNLFRDDVLAMCQASKLRNAQEDDGEKGSATWTTLKITEVVQQVAERTGKRQRELLEFEDDRHKFALAVEATNNEAAMQSWRKVPFPERVYERLTHDVVCGGLSGVDEKIARYELQTSLPDSFIGQSYRYDDTGQSEAWMKSVVDETNNTKKKKLSQALSADEGVIRAQVNATMQGLLISVIDKVMTEGNVLRQPELQSANWMDEKPSAVPSETAGDQRDELTDGQETADTMDTDDQPDSVARLANQTTETAQHDTTTRQSDIVEQPVWGMDCYTRRNILSCLQVEMEPEIALTFVEKWLLPAINACPEHLAHDIGNAAELLEFQSNTDTVLGRALVEKISAVGPPWLKPAANQLRRARKALGLDFFRVHPKGHGSVVLSPSIPPNSLVTFYRGELYPSWRWGEKMDAIDITQARKHLKPNLPDFYNMALERPQKDPRGYGLLFVDASRKAGHGSSLSHSCDPTCEVRVAAFEGELCLAMTTIRELEMGEELTFDYNAVTESLNEYRSAVCLCGYRKCRGSFLHFATADCYQQVLNRNSPIAARFASLVRGSMKKVMSADDEKVLQNHGFLTASFGAISVNRREAATNGKEKLVDSLDVVPIWLRTYVADTLRYIEYERRALPIALICDHLSSKEGGTKANASETKEPKREPSFFFFARTETEFLKNLLKEQGLPMSMNRLQMAHAIKKVASSHWAGMSDEEKLHYKELAKKAYEKKLKDWKAGKTREPAKKKKRSGKPEIDDILDSSTISFQDADGEGVAAMEQRIQQLTQTLSRIGRVLDRDREESYHEDSERTEISTDIESIRDRVQSPLRVLSDEEVVGWMWNSQSGLAQSFLRCLGSCRSCPPSLTQAVRLVYERFSALEAFGDPETSCPPVSLDERISEPREALKDALLEMRDVVLEQLKEMRKSFMSQNQKEKAATMSQLSSEANSICADSMVDTDIDSIKDPTALDQSGEVEPADVVEPHTLDELPDASDAEPLIASSGDKSQSDAALPVVEKINLDTSRVDTDENNTIWMEFYGKRYTLEAAADVLLLYAHTSTFFVLQPYRSLTSTPVEVYAREIGNKVPLSVVDEEIADDAGTVSLPIVTKAEDASVSGAPSELGEQPKSRASNDRAEDGLCAPDDIVAKVSVKYQGDYVLSQLLQWYNGGIGQKPGLPDILGCILLPRIADCFSSSYAKKSSLKSERKTAYSTKIRPALVEWLQDPYRRGNPLPDDISKAFIGTEFSEIRQDATSCFVPFGSPIVDFLVAGDESNIAAILSELDAHDKVGKKRAANGLLSSVDKGRPAQAVSTWVQCERPECMKWRKIPWFVDSDLLPEKFFCEDNKWDQSANYCDAPEEDWGNADALVGSDGKVEGSPVKKSNEEFLSVMEEESFRIGNRFDVKKSEKEGFRVARVTKTDFSGLVKRIHFHFDKTRPDSDQWVEFGSPRIASLYSKTKKPVRQKKASSKDTDKKNDEKTKGTKEKKAEAKKEKKTAAKKNGFEARDPKHKESFVLDGRFDVRRSGQKKYFSASVREVVFNETEQKIKFHYSKTDESLDEWVEFGSDRICAFNSRRKRLSKNSASAVARPLPDLATAIAFSTGKLADGTLESTNADTIRQVSDMSSRVDSDLTSLGDAAAQGSRVMVADSVRSVPMVVDSENSLREDARRSSNSQGNFPLDHQHAPALTNGLSHNFIGVHTSNSSYRAINPREHRPPLNVQPPALEPSADVAAFLGAGANDTGSFSAAGSGASFNRYQGEQSRFASAGLPQSRDHVSNTLSRAFDGIGPPPGTFLPPNVGLDRFGGAHRPLSSPQDMLLNPNVTRQALESISSRPQEFSFSSSALGTFGFVQAAQQPILRPFERPHKHPSMNMSLQHDSYSLNSVAQPSRPLQQPIPQPRLTDAGPHQLPSHPEAPARPPSQALSGLDILAAVTNFAAEAPGPSTSTMLSPQQQQRLRSLVQDGGEQTSNDPINNGTRH